MNTEIKIKGSYRKFETAYKAICEALKTYYDYPNCKRNHWRYFQAIDNAKKQLEETGKYFYQGAQWGGKWGNYYHAVGLNSKGHYVFVAGFNISKELENK